MTGQVLEVCDAISPDRLGTDITVKWQDWDNRRQIWKTEIEEIRRYVYATDSTQTSNASLPWKNKTTIPKLCQIRDNLYSNYVATLQPQRKNIYWDANEKDANSTRKRDSIVNYMTWSVDQPSYKHEYDKVILDYIDFGNCFFTVEWLDERVQVPDGRTQAGYTGPSIRRINPLDIVFNPTAPSFRSSPKIVRSLISRGELKELLQRLSSDENKEEYEELWNYLMEIRNSAMSFQGDWTQRDNLYAMDGFSSFRDYLKSDNVEVLTFYGDMYDRENDVLLKNHVITVVDRHKVIGKKPNPSFFGYPPIIHVPWRKRQDNLWGQGPLANLVGMQYRMDHIENMGADIWDLTAYPVQKVKGFVEEFTWQPGEKIFVGEEGDVDLVAPNVNIMQADMKIERLERLMEEMAGMPREAMGFRTPGEKTKYEVQRMENASARLFQNKIKQFQEVGEEPGLNFMLELARRNLTGSVSVKVFDDEFKIASFQTLTVEDITGVGRIKPVAARHFAEQADLIQNLTSLTGSQLWPVVQPHFSGIRLAKILEEVFNLKDYEVVIPYIALAEQADAQKQINALQEQIATEGSTASGMNGDFDLSMLPQTSPVGNPAGPPPEQEQGAA